MWRTFNSVRAGNSDRAGGFTLIEVLVGLAILVAGILAVAAVFPYTFKAQREAEVLTIGVSLAQMKAEEIRRDDSRDGKLVQAIRQMSEPSAPLVFPHEPRLSYSFCGKSLLYQANSNEPGDQRGASGVARVIIRYAPNYRPSQDVVYELRFTN